MWLEIRNLARLPFRSLFCNSMELRFCVRELPGGPVIKTLHFHCSVLDWGTKIPQVMWPKKTKTRCCVGTMEKWFS